MKNAVVVLDDVTSDKNLTEKFQINDDSPAKIKHGGMSTKTLRSVSPNRRKTEKGRKFKGNSSTGKKYGGKKITGKNIK